MVGTDLRLFNHPMCRDNPSGFFRSAGALRVKKPSALRTLRRVKVQIVFISDLLIV
jgi:hypothetical protein